jgi:hypothetical protein
MDIFLVNAREVFEKKNPSITFFALGLVWASQGK